MVRAGPGPGYREAIVDEVLMLRRIHAGNTMLRRSTDARAAYMRLIAERLKARR